MQRTTIYNKVLASAILALSLSACVKDHLYSTPHPDGGVVTVITPLPEGTSSDDYTVEINGTPIGDGDGSYNNSDPLPPGEYDVVVYNTPDGITIEDGIAHVDKEDGQDDVIISQPDQLYSGTGSVIVAEDDTTQLYLSVEQITHDLYIRLTLTEGDPESIEIVTGTLSGIAGSYDLQSGTLCGDPVSTNIVFTVDGDQVNADLRILGTMGDTQTLTLHIVFADGRTQDVVCDVSELLATLNDSTAPFTLTGELHTPIEAGFEAYITGWTETDNGSVDIH